MQESPDKSNIAETGEEQELTIKKEKESPPRRNREDPKRLMAIIGYFSLGTSIALSFYLIVFLNFRSLNEDDSLVKGQEVLWFMQNYAEIILIFIHRSQVTCQNFCFSGNTDLRSNILCHCCFFVFICQKMFD